MTGGVRADRVGAKLSCVHVRVRFRVNPAGEDERRTRALSPAKAGAWQREVPAAKAARPLARETSVGGRVVLVAVVSRPTGSRCWHAALLKGSDAGRGPGQRCPMPERGGRAVQASARLGSQDPGDHACEGEGEAAATRDRASRRKPRFQGAGVHQARACAGAAYLGEENGARERTFGRASAGLGHRGSVDSVVVLAGCLGCRSRRAALGPGRLTRRKASCRKASCRKAS